MFRKILSSMMVFLVAVMVLASGAFAEDVYVTKYGKKYHKKDSRFIKGKETMKLDREEAEAQGYKPSSDFKDDDEKSSKETSE